MENRIITLTSFLIALAILAACSTPTAAPSPTSARATPIMTYPAPNPPDPSVLTRVAPSTIAPPLPTSLRVPPSSTSSVTNVNLSLTDKYLMAFHACDNATTNCRDPRNHRVYLAQSNDGAAWKIAPGWIPYSGSVPDVIRRGNMLYLYTPSQVVRYNLDTHTLTAPTYVQISGGNSFVDPSPTLDDQGRIVLFFLYGQVGSDPAGCLPNETTCVKRFGSITEVAGSDGTQFTIDPGDRAAVTLSSNLRSASDPDIFYDGKQYVLYISHGPSIGVWVANELRGTYVPVAGSPGELFVNNTGGVPTGYFDRATSRYWTFAHAPRNNVTTIRRAVHGNFARALAENDWTTVISGLAIGLTATTNVESPGFAINAP